MAEYQKIEYRIGKDGKISETVLNGSGTQCTTSTRSIESALGEVMTQELLPEYYQEDSMVGIDTLQSLEQP